MIVEDLGKVKNPIGYEGLEKWWMCTQEGDVYVQEMMVHLNIV